MKFLAMKVEDELLHDFDIAAKSHHRSRSQHMRELMIEEINKIKKKDSALFEGKNNDQ
ncbi:MAG: hypothetical protein GOV02_01710 [Candidatus Aenigmarchaeota archaeon]|nr:hypothetical protein [Candidatus Aenigmarchaeota archaeon]